MEYDLNVQQNLCAARLFLNLFNLSIEENENYNESSEIKIKDINNNYVGTIFFKDDDIIINACTSIGILKANYKKTKLWGLMDLELYESFLKWKHDIKYTIYGKSIISGDTQIGLHFDTNSNKYCALHSTIKYIDENSNKVVINIQDDGFSFCYTAKGVNFEEELTINPNKKIEANMYHSISEGQINKKEIFRYPYSDVKIINTEYKYDKKYISAFSRIIKNHDIIDSVYNCYYSLGEHYDKQDIIQKGVLMQKIDPTFKEKIQEIFLFFENDDLSFLNNLIDMSFDNYSEEERLALFGLKINKLLYYNNATNVLDAYLGTNGNSPFKNSKIKLLNNYVNN